MDLEDKDFGWYDKTQLAVIQAQHIENLWIPGNQPESVFTPKIRNSNHRSEVYTEDWNSHGFKVIRLAATVIVCMVVAVLMCELSH